MNIEYGQWERGLLPVIVDGEPAGFLSEDVDGWAYWRDSPVLKNCVEFVRVGANRKAAVTGAPDL